MLVESVAPIFPGSRHDLRYLPMRPSFPETFMDIAVLMARRATCERRRVGAVAVVDRRPVVSGYNGPPPGQAHCTEVGCTLDPDTGGCSRSIHAEANVVAWAARRGTSLEGAEVYTTTAPCRPCAQLLVAAGVETVRFLESYRRTGGLDFLRDAGVKVVQTLGSLRVEDDKPRGAR